MGTQTSPDTDSTATLAKKKRRLLMVTNRQEMRRLRAILKPVAARIDWAADVPSAETSLESQGAYDAIIVDDRLPANGWQKVMERARDLGVKAPFLVCTNLEGSDEFLTESKKTFISDLLLRPYAEDVVRARVSNALETDQTEPYGGATVPSHQ